MLWRRALGRIMASQASNTYCKRSRSVPRSSSSSSTTLQQYDLRVFCDGTRGGNPVTVFSGCQLKNVATQKHLAQSCDFESVMVHTDITDNRIMSFFLPNGNAVPFCAHAAIGGAFATASWQFGVGENSYTCTRLPDEMVALTLQTEYQEKSVDPRSNALQELLKMQQVAEEGIIGDVVNASVARNKTLIHVQDVAAVQPPNDPERYRDLCDAIQSSGLYFYSKRNNDGRWDCRQFPRYSGYAEDPATGIAAAALAVSLKHEGWYHQGRQMDRPSQIGVRNIQRQQQPPQNEDDSIRVSLDLVGRVVLDHSTTRFVEGEAY